MLKYYINIDSQKAFLSQNEAIMRFNDLKNTILTEFLLEGGSQLIEFILLHFFKIVKLIYILDSIGCVLQIRCN